MNLSNSARFAGRYIVAIFFHVVRPAGDERRIRQLEQPTAAAGHPASSTRTRHSLDPASMNWLTEIRRARHPASKGHYGPNNISITLLSSGLAGIREAARRNINAKAINTTATAGMPLDCREAGPSSRSRRSGVLEIVVGTFSLLQEMKNGPIRCVRDGMSLPVRVGCSALASIKRGGAADEWLRP
jgi:hypothetical protein